MQAAVRHSPSRRCRPFCLLVYSPFENPLLLFLNLSYLVHKDLSTPHAIALQPHTRLHNSPSTRARPNSAAIPSAGARNKKRCILLTKYPKSFIIHPHLAGLWHIGHHLTKIQYFSIPSTSCLYLISHLRALPLSRLLLCQ